VVKRVTLNAMGGGFPLTAKDHRFDPVKISRLKASWVDDHVMIIHHETKDVNQS